MLMNPLICAEPTLPAVRRRASAGVWQPYRPNASPAMSNHLTEFFHSRLAAALAAVPARELGGPVTDGGVGDDDDFVRARVD